MREQKSCLSQKLMESKLTDDETQPFVHTTGDLRPLNGNGTSSFVFFTTNEELNQSAIAL